MIMAFTESFRYLEECGNASAEVYCSPYTTCNVVPPFLVDYFRLKKFLLLLLCAWNVTALQNGELLINLCNFFTSNHIPHYFVSIDLFLVPCSLLSSILAL